MTGAWGPFHRHFGNDAIHRDGGPECDQPGTPRTVYVFDPDYLEEHDDLIRADERSKVLTIDGMLEIEEKIRADERERIATAIEEMADDFGWDEVIATKGEVDAMRDVVKDALHGAARLARRSAP